MHIPSIAIVGGGFSGTSLAINLHRFARTPVDIHLIEKRPHMAQGLAYSTQEWHHLLNVRAHEMSLFVDKPNDLIDWLERHPSELPVNLPELPLSEQFIPRRSFAKYLHNKLQTALSASTHGATIHCINEEVVDISERIGKLSLQRHNGPSLTADKVVLAIGNPMANNLFNRFTIQPEQLISNPWQNKAFERIQSDSTVMIVGTGLTMVDTVLSLYHRGHQGKLIALSRHGLPPRAHQAKKLKAQQIVDAPEALATLTHHLHYSGEHWRDHIDALRPQTQARWKSFTRKQQKQFLRHCRTYWDIHRHRIAPEVAELLHTLEQEGQLKIVAGRIVDVKQIDQSLDVSYRPRHAEQCKQVICDFIINCTGPNCAYEKHDSALIQCMFEQGLCVADPLKLGLAVSENNALVNSEGLAAKNLFTLGPPSKGTYWECVAVPDIRQQSDTLAKHLLQWRN